MKIVIRQGYNEIKSEATTVQFLDMANGLEDAGHKIEKIILCLREEKENEISDSEK